MIYGLTLMVDYFFVWGGVPQKQILYTILHWILNNRGSRFFATKIPNQVICFSSPEIFDSARFVCWNKADIENGLVEIFDLVEMIYDGKLWHRKSKIWHVWRNQFKRICSTPKGIYCLKLTLDVIHFIKFQDIWMILERNSQYEILEIFNSDTSGSIPTHTYQFSHDHNLIH